MAVLPCGSSFNGKYAAGFAVEGVLRLAATDMAYQVTLSNARRSLAEVVASVDAHVVTRVELGSRGSAMDPWETDCRNWASSGLGKKLHPVDSSTAEYEAICERFYATVDEGTYEISWIHRVENLPLHNAFRMACENKATTDSDFDPEEGVRWLFHGTRAYKALNSIVNCTTTGFHTLLTGSVTGHLHGQGVYFAKDGNYTSLRYTSPAHDADGTRLHGYSQIIVANVIVGKFKKGPDVRAGRRRRRRRASCPSFRVTRSDGTTPS